MEALKCPECGAHNDGAAPVDGGTYSPKKDDISLCMYCGSINLFNDDLTIRPIPSELLLEIKKNEPETYETLMSAVIYIKANKKQIRANTTGWKGDNPTE